MALLLGELGRVKREAEEAALNCSNGERKQSNESGFSKGDGSGGQRHFYSRLDLC